MLLFSLLPVIAVGQILVNRFGKRPRTSAPSGNTQVEPPSGLVNPLGESLNPSTPRVRNTQVGTPSGLVNPLGEPLSTSTPKGGSGSGSGKNGNGTSGVSSVKPCCDIIDVMVGKGADGEHYAYITAGRDEELEKLYGERVHAHTIYPADIIHLERVGNPRWGFLPKDKLPRWRKVVRGIVAFITLVGGTAVLTPFVGPIPAAIISAAAALGVRKLFTLGRSVKFSAETADLNLTNGYVPKRDYDILQRLVRGAADCPQSGAEAAAAVGIR